MFIRHTGDQLLTFEISNQFLGKNGS